MTNEFAVSEEVLKAVEGSTLFYPCSGPDFIVPLELFAPFVSEFWFVDTGYFGTSKSANHTNPVFQKGSDYELIEKTVVGPPTFRKEMRTDQNTGKQIPFIEPCVLTETYRHRPTGKSIKVHRRRGYGKSAFDKEISSLGVFFYRGDSSSEGGSGSLWLWRKQLKEVLSKLITGGLIVTDGSQHNPCADSEYRELWKLHGENSKVPSEAVDQVEAFIDKDGLSFSCVGYAGFRYGPTLIWQVQRPT